MAREAADVRLVGELYDELDAIHAGLVEPGLPPDEQAALRAQQQEVMARLRAVHERQRRRAIARQREQGAGSDSAESDELQERLGGLGEQEAAEEEGLGAAAPAAAGGDGGQPPEAAAPEDAASPAEQVPALGPPPAAEEEEEEELVAGMAGVQSAWGERDRCAAAPAMRSRAQQQAAQPCTPHPAPSLAAPAVDVDTPAADADLAAPKTGSGVGSSRDADLAGRGEGGGGRRLVEHAGRPTGQSTYLYMCPPAALLPFPAVLLSCPAAALLA